ncbi:glutathione S-transferase [Roseateles asaccharophilus]|uniref:Glutathione S-transferase n=1 Tax=Roseateles asaccharophilus TaxID=582607 RepID=A0ABU2AEZ8_9BURK|nr:glutathione S-transferase [Roseateles asaccharophilus]MDR7335794.1 glutathione S-transferase [Roseateles asaccharophilus]
MITVHHLNNSRSQRVLWLLEELGLPYDIKHYQRDAKTSLAPPELKQVHPLGKSPVITDGALTVAESGAILEYLVDKYGQGRLKPTDEQALLHYRYFMHFAEGSAMPPLVMKLVFNKVKRAPAPFFIKPIAKSIAGKVLSTFVQPNIDRQLKFLEGELAARPWFAGAEFSAADVQMSFPIEAAASRGADMSAYPKLKAFLDRIHARPAYKQALERGGKYDLLS